MLDGVIWKLRDGRIARALLRVEPTTSEPIAPENRLGRRLAWLACAGALGIYVVYAWELEFGVRKPSERGDFARQEKAIQRLPDTYVQVITMYDLEGRPLKEVARALNRTLGATSMLRARAHRRLAELMGTASRFLSDSA